MVLLSDPVTMSFQIFEASFPPPSFSSFLHKIMMARRTNVYVYMLTSLLTIISTGQQHGMTRTRNFEIGETLFSILYKKDTEI
jgi:hypothetical protein